MYVCVLLLRYVKTDHKHSTSRVFVQWKHRFQICRFAALLGISDTRWKPGLTWSIFFCWGKLINPAFPTSGLRLLKLFVSLKLHYLQIDLVSSSGILPPFAWTGIKIFKNKLTDPCMLLVFACAVDENKRKDWSVTCLSKVVAGNPLPSEYTTEVCRSFCDIYLRVDWSWLWKNETFVAHSNLKRFFVII